MTRISYVATLAVVLGSLLAAPVQAMISRTYVASSGSDANAAFDCNFTTPCRTFQTALNSTLAGGEILAVDGSGYGAVTIDRSVSIIANPGVFAGIGVFASSNGNGTGVYVNTAGVNVVLRGLTFNGQGGSNGVEMANGNRLSVENCVFAGFSGGTAIYVHTAATANILNTLARDGGNGVYLANGAAASISESQVLGNNSAGIYVAGAGISATVSASMVTRNATGLSNNGGTLKSLGNNNVTDNTNNTSGTITSTPLM